MTLGLPVPALISGILAVAVDLKLRMLENTMDGVRGLMNEGDIGICRSEEGNLRAYGDNAAIAIG